jgi:putative transposase
MAVYVFVIMPNHIHLIVEPLALNGKESPLASFKKYTAHLLMNKGLLGFDSRRFSVKESDRQYRIWIENSRAVEVYSPEVVYQKLDYIHHNPVSGKWNLADDFVQYRYSSASFYEEGQTEFGFLTHIGDRL